ncbi:FAD-dependent oxidoreductase [Bermanella marisrubri]|uniref:Pyruvate/2-oxoglutarate dehydrogenase complex dihydrolipoamide dehydrogenase (E3) component and related enzyme n=1 Tax=Bermanella marisrubri TaxID=207949 RepID=Q1MYW0_9GAMM|nr:bifunctional TVP38/TMEM64 family protein/FAD-dependent oxidoreductase [Bermanella marisrubri]EAT11181.1 Pyruvate/2-oxoglutarate dehydrogenase complex dihydrolipoamide dehydrogenase (E3) component and related enzyme [Oceanobacter sp. RED65] [Bermanella marisrubri]QIZ83370.1 FAD-dependent oxidoreductase [Bermanella marisrubri]
MKRLILLCAIFTTVIAFFALDLHQWLTLEALKGGLGQFNQWLEQSPVIVGAAFFVIYVAVTALSLPGAAVMTLAAGAIFGLAWGLLLVSFASSIGATLAFLVSRYLLHDTVQQRFGDRLKAINEGIKKEGAFYLFTLRLVPIFPFFLINLVMGLTPIKAWTFYWVSQVGMFAGTIVYVNAGTQLAQIDSLSGILSPDLILSFALLGIFPLLAKKLISIIKARRVYKNWKKPKSFDRNLIVIGAGAGGLVSAYIAAAVKAKVTLIEANKMGGDCLNYGCVPSKALIKTAKVAKQMRHASQYGLNDQEPQFSFKKVMERIHNVIKSIEPHDSVERYEGLGVEVLQGYGRLIDPWTVEVKLHDGSVQTLTSRSIVIAAGAEPFVPPLDGIDDVNYVTSDTLWDRFAEYDELPKRIVVLGGGPIGSELSQAFARLGSDVSQVEMGERIIAKEDLDVSEYAKEKLESDGVTVLIKHKAIHCGIEHGDKYIVLEHDGEEKRVYFDELICAVGRTARLKGYGLEELGIETDRTVITNEYLQTLYPNIYAAGDVAGPYQFTHTASHQAWYAAVNGLFGQLKKFKVDYRVIPWVTYLDPEIARVGLSESEAIEQGIDFEVTRYGIDDLDRALAESEATGFVKVLTPPGKDKILGVTIVGSHAGELLTEFVLAMKYGIGLNKILGTIHAYPVWSEANKFAAGQWKQSNKPEKVLKWVEKYHNWMRS